MVLIITVVELRNAYYGGASQNRVKLGWPADGSTLPWVNVDVPWPLYIYTQEGF